MYDFVGKIIAKKKYRENSHTVIKLLPLHKCATSTAFLQIKISLLGDGLRDAADPYK